jgi:acetyl esterase
MPKTTAARAILLTTALTLGACQQLSNLTGSGTVAGKETGTAGRSAGATVTAQRTDHDMSQVISALAALGAQPIESLSVERARRQPSPADAVRRVLQERGQSPASRPVAQVRDVLVPTAAGPIPARVYGPARGAIAAPLIVYWHGGGWVIADLDT